MKMKTLTIRITPGQRDGLDAVARRRGLAFGTAVREVIAAGLQQQADTERFARLEAQISDLSSLIRRLAIED